MAESSCLEMVSYSGHEKDSKLRVVENPWADMKMRLTDCMGILFLSILACHKLHPSAGLGNEATT